MRYLRTPEAVRSRCARVLELAEQDLLAHLRVRPERLGDVADLVVDVTRETYPSLVVPVHGRMTQFDAGGVRRTAELELALKGLPADERGRALIDLVVVSVLLDAGAGATWRYQEPAGRFHAGGSYTRSEGLAVASLRLFLAGGFSSDPQQPLRADAAGLRALSRERLAAALQVTPDNAMIGLDGRLALLHRLAALLPRPGALLERIRRRAHGDTVHAGAVLIELLNALSPIWPGGSTVAGAPLGDVWPLAALAPPVAPLSQQLVPFHQLAQWLAYSLVVPLAAVGLHVIALGELTGLAEYRNGGLFLDGGVLELRDPSLATKQHQPGDQLVVEWRACTVALLDRLAHLVRVRLDKTDAELPLGMILAGGTWRAGRILAAERRPDGGSPLDVHSDGTFI